MALSVQLERYGVELTIPFQVTVEGCTVTGIDVTQPDQLEIHYQLAEDARAVPLPEVFLTPEDCG